MRKRKEVKITQDQLEYILGNEWKFFKTKILSNCYCHHCNKAGNATIVDYEIFVNDLNDTLFKGKCKKSGNPVARYTETGENEEMVKRINETFNS